MDYCRKRTRHHRRARRPVDSLRQPRRPLLAGDMGSHEAHHCEHVVCHQQRLLRRRPAAERCQSRAGACGERGHWFPDYGPASACNADIRLQFCHEHCVSAYAAMRSCTVRNELDVLRRWPVGRTPCAGGGHFVTGYTPSVGAPVGRDQIFAPTNGRTKAKPVYKSRSDRRRAGRMHSRKNMSIRTWHCELPIWSIDSAYPLPIEVEGRRYEDKQSRDID
jgi:hypothetical protein